MPMMDGWEFRKQQLEDPALSNVPVVCMTGMVHPEDVERIQSPSSWQANWLPLAESSG